MTSIGTLHPLIVHLPIGILMFAALLFLLKKLRSTEEYDKAIVLALGVSMICAVIAVVTGLLLSDIGGYDQTVLNRHKWLGIGTAAIIVPIFILARKGNFGNLTSSLFGISIVALIAAGHFGGTLTHGTDYLFAQDTSGPSYQDFENIPVYQGLVVPILKKRCYSCHNPNKKKGELVMSTYDDLMSGGESGVVIDLNSPELSTMLGRIHLSISDKEHMPPKGKQQLELDEIQLLEWWINNGACTECVLSDISKKEQLNGILTRYELLASEHTDFEPLSDKRMAALTTNGVMVSSLSNSDPFISISLSGSEEVSSNAVSAIRKARENIREIKAANCTLNNSLVNTIAKCTNLEVLQLQNSSVSDADIKRLARLPSLKVLNLYGTIISDNAINDIATISTLRRLYCWQSDITPEGIDQVTKQLPLLEVFSGPDVSIFEVGQLHSPVILASADWFTDSVTVSIKTTASNSSIHYTLDGTMPDSTSQKYEKPLVLNASHSIKAITAKTGWRSSDISSKSVIKTSQSLSGIQLSVQPSPQYAGQGEKTLMDLQKGSMDFRDGKWLGYQGRHVVVTLELADPDLVSEVFISALSDPASWIFYPAAIKVEISQDGKQFDLVQNASTSRDHRIGSEAHIFNVSFPTREASHIRVEIQSILANPEWHPVPGGEAWVFVDEVLVN